MKKVVNLKKITWISILIIILYMVGITWSMAANNFNVKLETASKEIKEEQKEVKLYLKLGEYNGDGILGYEGTLEYDKDVFESATIKELNDWEEPDYDATTNKFLSTTKKAKANVNIAEITLKLKANATAKTTKVSVKDLIVSDGVDETTNNPYITYTLLANKTKPEEETNTVEETNVVDTNTIISNIVIETNTQTDTGSNITIEKVNPEEDQTLASTTIPQTGNGAEFIVLVIVILTIGIGAYIRYRSIPLK